jgi:hypothetical protein
MFQRITTRESWLSEYSYQFEYLTGHLKRKKRQIQNNIEFTKIDSM